MRPQIHATKMSVETKEEENTDCNKQGPNLAERRGLPRTAAACQAGWHSHRGEGPQAGQGVTGDTLSRGSQRLNMPRDLEDLVECSGLSTQKTKRIRKQ